MSAWKTLASKKVYETAWFKVREDTVTNHLNQEITYSAVSLHHPSVTIVAMNSDGNILMQRQYRYPSDKTFWEFPAGNSDGEPLLVAAKRELLEETGLASDDWTKLGDYYASVGIADIPGSIFLAQNVRSVSSERDEAEDIKDQLFMSLDQIDELARGGELVDIPVLAALYYLNLQEQGAHHG
jgi:8-oxo-dGTP pyrophosphatase MutT (NUDIX family)